MGGMTPAAGTDFEIAQRHRDRTRLAFAMDSGLVFGASLHHAAVAERACLLFAGPAETLRSLGRSIPCAV